MKILEESASVVAKIARNVTVLENVLCVKMERFTQRNPLAAVLPTAGNVTKVVGAIAIPVTSDIR
jgi:hypothetical protein